MPAPRFITCPICGRGFGSASIDIHVPQCYDKAIKRWRLDPSGPRPVMPAGYGGGGGAGAGAGGGGGRGGRGGKKASGRGGGRGGGGGGFGGGFDDQPAGAGASAARSLKRDVMMDEAPPTNENLHPCSKCGRRFNYDRISYHESVCKGDQKRPVFDSSRQRMSTDDGQMMGYSYGGARSSRGGKGGKRTGGQMGGYRDSDPARVPKTNWRQQHNEFINAIREAKRADASAAAMWGAPPASKPSARSGADFRGGAGNFQARGVGGDAQPPAGRGGASKENLPAAHRPRNVVPANMVRQNEARKANIASGGRAAREANKPRPNNSNFARGPSTSARTDYNNRPLPAGGGGGRIINDNTTSLGMMQAFGRA